ncbi:RagB/SusD family nutrient uptake outer membrane protein [Microbacter margulisiae]|uniref:Starch-binding associating with outer membrane n=1 Tax=Microbacter margulisiae TaxID=1350067 RepID=A0A7W5DR01_9PORP|nr:RagB/SusD family nutrient uptake outer membrane protein [Microbacter margulisiae]MBB3187366.1 hypothetical protein [Microbacter margulisiae]
MKNIYKISISFLLLIALSGCSKDFLIRTPKDELSPATFFQNETQCKMALMGVYSALQPNATPTQFYQYDFMSDNGLCEDSWQGSKEIGDWLTNSSSWAPYAKWTQDYNIVARANQFIQDMNNATVSDAIKNQMIAEAKFLRGYAYSDLITYFGDVPLITKVQTLSEAYVSRTSKSDVLTAILADFDAAASVLPVSYGSSDVGRATKGAALAFKARILLYNGEWADAAQACKDVMNLDAYHLYPDYTGLFSEDHEDNEEVIFDIQYVQSQPQPWPSSALQFQVWPTGNATCGLIDSYYMTNGLPITNSNSGYDPQNPFVNRDLRLAASVVLPGSQFGSSVFIPANNASFTGARARKYADLENSNAINICTLNTILMRYADILLMRAEALIESGNTGQEVYDLIDQVRARVNMPKIEDVEGTGLSQTQLRAILRHERRVEFYNEGTRYADMLRWKDTSLVHDAYGYDKTLLSDPSNPSKWVFKEIDLDKRTFDAAKGWLWPIPEADIEINKNLLPNNPGY